MTLNNRIIRTMVLIKGEPVYSFSIREVYYDDKGNIESWTGDDMKFVGEDMKDLWENILFRLEAFKAPVLDLVKVGEEEKLIEL